MRGYVSPVGRKLDGCCWSSGVCNEPTQLPPVDLLQPIKLHLATSELWLGQQQEEILPELLSSSGIV